MRDRLFNERQKKAEKIRNLGINPFSTAKFEKTFSAKTAKNLPAKNLEEIQNSEKNPVKIAGRLVLFRAMGRLAFGQLLDGAEKIQICFQKNHFKVENLSENSEISPMKFVEKLVDLGDFLGVAGDIFETKHGEKTLFIRHLKFLSKSLRPLPEKFHGLENREKCYRERNLDLISNAETFSRFEKRSQMIAEMRNFFHEKKFLEIETPILQSVASGAMAKPFLTHHNALDHDFVLRIALEIDLKKAVGGGFERVFEIGKCFRNEGSDPSHLQEFTMCEWYAAFEDLETNKKWTEELLKKIAKKVFGKSIFEVFDKNENPVKIDFEKKFESVKFADLLEKYAGINMFEISDADLKKVAKKLEIDEIENRGRGNLLDDIYKKTARPHLINPTFVTDWPSDLKPLAAPNGDGTSRVFQLLVAGWEIVNSYGELIDPIVQRELFEAQAAAKNAGDDEAMEIDESFLAAMEHGFPPMTGSGFGVDRIAALLSGQKNLRDVVLFPTMKPENSAKKKEKTKIATILLNDDAKLENWQKINTAAHLSAEFAAKNQNPKNLFLAEKIETKDAKKIPLNIKHAIVIKTAPKNADLKKVFADAKAKNLEIAVFSREMLETTDDKIVAKKSAEKDFSEIEFLGILIFGEKKTVDEITKNFPLFSG